MKYGKKIYLSIFWVALGAGLAVFGFAGMIPDSWATTGFALMAVGTLQIIRQIRYRTNEEYKEKVDVALEDERNKFIHSKAWAWAGYLFVLIAALTSIAFQIMGMEEQAVMASFGVCLLILLYWGSYMVLRKKY